MKKTLKRRRLQAKTDYKTRLALLKSGKPRLVVRKSNKYITAQIVETDIAQDKVIAGITSRVLLSKGWPKDLSGSLKSKQAAYLTGLILGNLAKDKTKSVILDIGMNRNISKSRVYAVLKGAIDSGLDIPHDSEKLISLDELKSNEKLASLVEKIKQEIKNG